MKRQLGSERQKGEVQPPGSAFDRGTPQTVRAPRGGSISCKGWTQEAALRMLMNNLDAEVAEQPDDLIIYA